MKKKIKDLTKEERENLCRKHKNCDNCRFNYGIACILNPVTWLMFDEIGEMEVKAL